MIIVAKYTGNGQFNIIGMSSSYIRKDVWVKADLDIGEYIVYTNVFENLRRDNLDICVSSYGVSHVLLIKDNNSITQYTNSLIH